MSVENLVEPFPVEDWLQPGQALGGTYAYWNDETIEADKVWNVERPGGVAAMESYLESSGLLALLRRANEQLAARGLRIRGTGADLACGVCWAAPHLLALGADRLYCVEYSSPRLRRLAPKVLRHYRVPHEKTVLCLGSFYELKLPDASLDFVFLSQAFHHADEPDALLAEIGRVLKPGGVVVMIGEHIVPAAPWLYVRHMARSLVQRLTPRSLQQRAFGHLLASKPFFASMSELLAPDSTTGDHYYRASDYARMFERARFAFEPVRDGSAPMLGYLLVKCA